MIKPCTKTFYRSCKILHFLKFLSVMCLIKIEKSILKLCFFSALLFLSNSGFAQKQKLPVYVENGARAQKQLVEQREIAEKQLKASISPEAIVRLIELGAWEKAADFLHKADTSLPEIQLAEAELFLKKHAYKQAEKRVVEVLKQNSSNTKAKLLRAKLYKQAWELDKAAKLANSLLGSPEKISAAYILGEIAMFTKKYEEALAWAKKMQSWNPNHALGYLLEGETLFWLQKPKEAEPVLQKALTLAPFNADARFAYGYAVWRRVDATQLDAMAAQWNLALQINPLHYRTHWHFGNGHTHLTYADYVSPSDSLVHQKMKKVDALVASGKVKKAIQLTKIVGKKFPKNVIPEMVCGSIFYMDYSMPLHQRLDSAALCFKNVLLRKKNYGPAHNGMAAVIKQRQFTYLDGYEQREQEIRSTVLPVKQVFYEVFPDLEYYPGQRVAKMVTEQIGPSRAYLPMINTLGMDFQLPPLHHNLAEAMKNSYFLYGTTFDNRQWMDIRGVGSGATGIEYIERGSHWERNVLAHEYAHLYHGRILTDKESRQIRALYHSAMKAGNTLDYYSANNESEFFAQAYAAYLSAKKVHPLTHKSMNTRSYLKRKDSVLYAFVETLIQKQKAFLQGDTAVLNSNWAQTYLSLAQRSRGDKKRVYLDKALVYDAAYLPALLAYAEFYAQKGQWKKAKVFLEKAKRIQSEYAPIYATYASFWHQKARQKKLNYTKAFQKQTPLFEKALRLEKDLAVRAQMNRTFRARALAYGQLAKAIQVGEEYLENAPVISTYLRDRKEQAQVFVKSLKSTIGYSRAQFSFFEHLVAQNPQNFSYRISYADVLLQVQNWNKALAVLQKGQRMLVAAHQQRPDYLLRLAKVFVHLKKEEAAKRYLAKLKKSKLSANQALLLTRIYLSLNNLMKAKSVFPADKENMLPFVQADWWFVKAKLIQEGRTPEKIIQYCENTLQMNPYHFEARQLLIVTLRQVGQLKKADQWLQKTEALPLGFGPDLHF